MSINKRQFDLLQAMGITVWQRRELSNQNSLATNCPVTAQKTEQDNNKINAIDTQTSLKSSQNLSQQVNDNDKITIDLKALLTQPLFNDILRSIGASSADLSMADNQIDLGIINWQFTLNKTLEFRHNCLKTPDLTTIANSPALKKSLWQLIGPLSST